jgi:hypothetical protein
MSNNDKINNLMWAITDTISDLVDDQAKKHGVDPDELFVAVANDMAFRAAMNEALKQIKQ